MSDHPQARPLRRALRFNATLSMLSALALLAFADALSPHLGDVPPLALRAVAAGLVPFVAFLVWQARVEPPRLRWAVFTIASDLLWAVGSATLLWLFSASVTAVGVAVVAGIAFGVALAAALQWHGLTRFIHRPDPRFGTAHRFEVTVDAPVAREALWPVVADLASIHEHSPGLASSNVESDAPLGVGAVRRCESRRGPGWAEEVTAFRPYHWIEMRFRDEDPGFPFPMAPMFGGWTLEARGADRTRVTVWWAFTARPRWAAPLIVAMMSADLRREMREVVGSMAETTRAQPHAWRSHAAE
ncbi:MAG TPA: SRPBCC family protein [Polyangiaceae bacterium LLY-WYZ-14_1]|nr:SRPBCC family protein [Polyangiaceae bacterium LLY-WYZ-14_1]